MSATVKKTVPKEWAECVDALKEYKGDYVWQAAADWRRKVTKFKEDFGGTIEWSMSDSEAREMSKKMAGKVTDLINEGVETDIGKAWIVCAICGRLEVDNPAGKNSVGVWNRGCCATWWLRVIRKKIARTIEHGSIRLGLVGGKYGAYASASAIERRGQQLERNAEALSKALIKNEAGQIFNMSELVKGSVANPEVRAGELMTRIRGCEEIADENNHCGLFITNTTPSAFHAWTVVNGVRRKNNKYDGITTPTDAQKWMCKIWSRARAAINRAGIQIYGFRVAEPHHDGTPHWHMLLWVVDGRENEVVEIIKKYWLAEYGEERGADKYRVKSVTMNKGGAAGYIAKYITKNVGNINLEHYGDVNGSVNGELDLNADNKIVWTGKVHGWQRVNTWAAIWGIRQFQAFGQPPVTVWRELRRVTKDQVEAAYQSGNRVASKAWYAVHRSGDDLASWSRYAVAMGGVAIKRADYVLKAAKRVVRAVVYGEEVEKKVIVGVECENGKWLISRRQKWNRVYDVVEQDSAFRAALAAPWTGFNNCTARLTGGLRRALLNI